MSETIVTLENVWKYYPMYYHIVGGFKTFLFNFPKAIKQMRHNKLLALSDIGFEVRKGESFGIIGRNGAGKSTILGLIAGIMKPSSGKIIVRGRVSPLLELGAGFHSDLTGRENIVLNGVLLGLTRSMVLERLNEIIDFSGLRELIDQPVRTYSSGMLARLGFSVVAHLEPEILLIDEILAVGDMEFQKKCLNKIREFKDKGVTIVFVTHNMEEIIRICNRAMWIDNHEVRSIGNVKDVVNLYSNHVGDNESGHLQNYLV
jgi:lipopolysaccharide transport system ATP-binding protein